MPKLSKEKQLFVDKVDIIEKAAGGKGRPMPEDMEGLHMGDMDKEAMRPVRKTEAGKYHGVDTSNIDAVGNDVDAAPMKKMMKKKVK